MEAGSSKNMIPFSIIAHRHLGTSSKEEYKPFRGSKSVRFLSLISVIVLFTFVPPPVAPQKNTLSKIQTIRKLDADHCLDLPVKLERGPISFPPPARITKPIESGTTGLISQVLVPKVFSYLVVQQPKDSPYYVSSANNLVTEFGLAKKYGTIGLIAHNHLAGKQFDKLTLGQEIYIIYQDGHKDRYIVSEIYHFHALDSTNINSLFIDLVSNEVLTAAELFDEMYTGTPHVTFQTCIYANGDDSWGRLFVIARPIPKTK